MATLSPMHAQGTTNATIIERSSPSSEATDVVGTDVGLNSTISPTYVIPSCGYGDAVAIAAVIIVVGYILIRGLKKLCDKLLPPPPSPPPPPPNPGTNTNHSASAMIQLNEAQTGSGDFPGIMFYLGNPGDTNGGSWNSASTGVNMWNIYEYSRTNSAFNDPLGVPYTVLMASTIMSTTNLADPVTWQKECSITGWISSASILQVWYTNGVPIATNWSLSNPGANTNSYSFPLNLISLDTVPQKFFRVSAE